MIDKGSSENLHYSRPISVSVCGSANGDDAVFVVVVAGAINATDISVKVGADIGDDTGLHY